MDVESHRLPNVYVFIVLPISPRSPRLSGSVAFVLVAKLPMREEVESSGEYHVSNDHQKIDWSLSGYTSIVVIQYILYGRLCFFRFFFQNVKNK